MTNRRAGLLICEHIALGAELTATRERLLRIAVQLGNAYPKTHRAVRLAATVEDQLNRLRSALDDASAEENPGDDDWSPVIYYGADRAAREPVVAAILDRHRSASPACPACGKAQRELGGDDPR
jgi:hypothetical protein